LEADSYCKLRYVGGEKHLI
jgi:hypothetical protein